MPKINREEYEVLKELDDKWKWIARDKNRCLYAFTGKPVKKYGPLLYWGTEGFLSFELFDEKHLFQFIQWEDSEPYNTQELIEEYEDSKEYKDSLVIEYFMDKAKEGEETEVKSKQELIKIIKSLARETSQNYPHEEMVELPDVLNAINQLDEPEVLSQEWIEEHRESTFDLDEDFETVFVRVRNLQNLLVPKQELPVIPKFVAEWIEKYGGNYKPSFLALGYDLYSNNITYPEVDKWIADNQETFARAWLDGFTVEEEQKYYVKDEKGNTLLRKVIKGFGIDDRKDKIVSSTKAGEASDARLTEQEIKDYDPRYMTFAKPVEELEE